MSGMKDSVNPEHLLRHADWLKALAHSLVADDARAQDIVQQTWLAALKTPPRSMNAARAWLGRVTRNFAFRSYNEESNRRKREESSAQSEKSSSTPEELLQRVELQREVADAVTKLPALYRATVLHHFFEEMSVTEIAHQHGIPVTTVRSRLTKALDLLRMQLDDKYGGSRRAWCLVLLPLLKPEQIALAGTAAGTAATAGTGLLVLKGIAMKATTKTAAVVMSIIVAGTLLTMTGIIPDEFLPWITEEPVVVSFRTIAQETTKENTPNNIIESDEPDDASIREKIAPTVQESTALSPTSAMVTAKVVNKNGYPLVGASMREVTMEGPLEEVAGNGRGQLRLELDAGKGRRTAHIEVGLAGYVSRIDSIRIEPGKTIHLGTIKLIPGGLIRGHVHDSDGNAVANARISLGEKDQRPVNLEMQRFAPPRPRFPITNTDASGAFLLAGIPEGFARIWVHKKEMIPTYSGPIEVRNSQETYGVKIIMDPLGDKNRIRGIVIDPTGAAVPFAQLDFAIHPRGPGVHYMDIKTAKKDGSFDFHLAEKSYMSITAKDPKDRFGPATAEEIDAGEQNLVLQLIEGEQIELHVFSETGAELGEYDFEILAFNDELPLQQGVGRLISDGGVRFRSPAQSFSVRVQASCFQTATAGPFQSEELDGRLDMHLTPIPGLHGTVHAGDQPITGARVSLYTLAADNERIERSGFRCRLDPIPLETVTSDKEGRFVVTPRRAGEYVVRVQKDGFAPSEIGPIKINPDLYAKPVEVSMSHGGAIEGTVILPYNENPAGTIVSINRGDGHARTVRVGTDGMYRFTHLIPGSWCVEKRDEEIWQNSTTTSPRTTPFESEVKWNCEVYEGKTTRYDVTIVEKGAFSLHGTLTLGDDPVEGWIAWLCPPDAYYYDNMGKYPTTTLDPRGGFQLDVDAAGEYRLVIKYATAQGECLFTDKVVITGPATPWKSKVTMGTLIVENLTPLSPEQDIPEMVYLWDGDISFFSLVIPDENGVCHLKHIPAGEGRLVKPSIESIMNPDEWKLLGKVTVKKGVETRVPAPKG